MEGSDITNTDEISLPKPILEWLVKVLEQNYKSDHNTSVNNGIDVKRIVFYDILQILQYCKDDTMKINKYHLKLKMKTKKYKNKKTGSVSLLLCLYGNLPLIVGTELIQVPVHIFIPNGNTYKILNPPLIVIEIEELLKNNLENDLIKAWIKDGIKFNDHFLNTDDWIESPLNRRDLIRFIDISIKLLQTSLKEFEKTYFETSMQQLPKMTGSSAEVETSTGEVQRMLAEVNIMDDLELEKRLGDNLKIQKEELFATLQTTLNNIHRQSIPKINASKMKQKQELQEICQFYRNVLKSSEKKRLSAEVFNSILADVKTSQFTELQKFTAEKKKLQIKNLNQIIDLENITYSSRLESWLLESESKVKAFDNLLDLLKKKFIEQKVASLNPKAVALIDMGNDMKDTALSNDLSRELDTIEKLASAQFDIKYDIEKHNEFSK